MNLIRSTAYKCSGHHLVLQPHSNSTFSHVLHNESAVLGGGVCLHSLSFLFSFQILRFLLLTRIQFLLLDDQAHQMRLSHILRSPPAKVTSTEGKESKLELSV